MNEILSALRELQNSVGQQPKGFSHGGSRGPFDSEQEDAKGRASSNMYCFRDCNFSDGCGYNISLFIYIYIYIHI